VWPETLRFLAKSGIDLSPLITDRFRIEQGIEAIEAAHHPLSTIKAHIELDATL
jgi:L-iditol 2-dehydrogenase